MNSKRNRRLVATRATSPPSRPRPVAVRSDRRRQVFRFDSERQRGRYLAELVDEGANAVESSIVLTDGEAERAA